MTDVFISYASEDREKVKLIVDQIKQGGWEIWWDRKIDAGVAFDREIEKAIDAASCIIVVWSRSSVASEWVRTEANEGLERGTLIPVSIENVKPPLAFRRIQTIDFNASNANEQLRESISRFVAPASQESADQTPFVGRELEKSRAEDLLDKVNDKVGKTILISGETGVGKTRLARELSALARRKGYMVLTGHCLEMEGAPPYQPLLDQISQAARITRPEDLRLGLGENAPEVAKLMPELRQQFNDIPEPAELPPDQERRYLLNGVADFIDRAARVRPMMLVYEDLHWADDSTCILLRYMTERLSESPIMIVGTYRDNELDSSRPFTRTLQELTKERLVEDIVLKRFDRQGVKEIIEGRARKPAPDALIDLVFSETEGNPYFVEEIFRHLEAEGKLFDSSGAFLTEVVKDTEVPRSVRLVIGERIDKVSDNCRTVLTTAAVAGKNFSFDLMISTNAKLDEDDILDALDEAEAANLIEDLSVRRDARYGFVHEQIRQTLLTSLSFPRRQRTHLRIATALEELYGAQAGANAGELSHHLYQAGSAADQEKTTRYLLLAGQRTLDALAFEDALRLYDSALEVCDENDHAVLAEIYQQRGSALSGMGAIDDSLAALDKARELADADSVDEIVFQRCRMLLNVWRGNEAVEDLERLLERKKTGEDRHAELEILRWVSRAYYVMSLDRDGYNKKALASYDETVLLARNLGNDQTLAQALIATTQFIDYDHEYYDTARQHLEEAQSIGARLNDEEIQIDVATARLNTALYDLDDSFGEQTLKKLLLRRDPIRTNAHYFRMMWSALGGARLERCVELCDAGTALAYRIGTLPVQYPTIKAQALLALGRFDEALVAQGQEIADEAHRFGAALQKLSEFQYLMDCAAFEEALEKTPYLISEAKYLSRVWVLAWVSMQLADATPYLMDNDKLLTTAESLIEDAGSLLDRTARAALAVAHGEIESAKKMIRDARPRNVTITDSRRYLRLQEQRISLAIRTGEFEAAAEELRECIPACRESKQQQVLYRLLARQAAVDHALGADEAAERNLQEAKQIHRTIGDTIASATHKAAFLSGSVAMDLGLDPA